MEKYKNGLNPLNGMNKRIGLALLMTALIIAMLAAPISAAETVRVKVDNGRPYYGRSSPPLVKYDAFYYLYGDKISWWQGGAKFILGTNTPEYKVIEEFMLALPSKLGIKVLAGELYLVEGYVKAKYVFDGIIQFKNYMFVDRGGIVLVEWEYGTGLNVTIYSKTTINASASQIEGYGFADWGLHKVGEWKGKPIYDNTPTAYIPANKKVLIIPVEGVVMIEDYRRYEQYLGGGPTLVKLGDRGRTVKAGQIFWDREPDYWLTYDDEGLVELWKVDNWFNKAVLIWPTPHEVEVSPAR